jgi:hypothetical protein
MMGLFCESTFSLPSLLSNIFISEMKGSGFKVLLDVITYYLGWNDQRMIVVVMVMMMMMMIVLELAMKSIR